MLYGLTNEFQWKLSSEAGVRPASNYGTAVTPGNNTMGSYAQVFPAAEVEFDVWGVLININSIRVQTSARDTLVTIGVDTAGGTSYVDTIPTLVTGPAVELNLGVGVYYYFPLHIPAGSSIAAKAAQNNATPGGCRVWMTLYGRPRRPEMWRKGSYVTAIGVDTANSRGTVVTPGTTSDGAWTSLGTPTKSHWWWQMGMGLNDASTTTGNLLGDIAYGDATTKILLLEDVQFIVNSTEYCMKPGEFAPDYKVAENIELFGRLQNSGVNDASYSVAAYGLGG